MLLIAVMIGIPAIAGALQVTEAAGRTNTTPGISLSVYASVLSGTFAYTIPVGGITGTQYFIKIPVVLAVSIVIGIIIGLVRRRME